MESKHHVEDGLVLNTIFAYRAVILQHFAGKDQAELVDGNVCKLREVHQRR